jgi:hypothetical protein
VSVTYRTVDGTAGAPGDYAAKAPTVLTIPKGQTSKTFTVTLKQDKVAEPNELFYVVLTNPVGTTIADDTGIGVILNDD